MISPTNTKKNRGPESAFYDTMKGQNVRVWMHGHAGQCDYVRDDPKTTHTPVFLAKLLWVDKYTIGIRLPGAAVDTMLNKKFIIRMERDENAGRAADTLRQPTVAGEVVR